MEEKKKRWRPSLTAYRALEREVDELREANRELRERLDSVRDTYNELLIRTDSERHAMKGEICRLNDALDECRAECKRLVNRSFFERLFNK